MFWDFVWLFLYNLTVLSMKKLAFLLITALFLPFALQSQNPKIVMLEPLGIDSIQQKNIIRTFITDAFINSGKYNTLVCSEIDSIMNKIGFQDNRITDNELCKHLEQICDADLVCIIRITSEANYSFIEARVVKMDEGETIKKAKILTLNFPLIELKKGCIQVANMLVGWGKRGSVKNIDIRDKRRNGELYNPDGIELVFVAASRTSLLINNSFYIGKYEVTQEQWKSIMGNNPSHFKGDNLPVEMVSWLDVQEFLRRLNEKTGMNYRLPTEAEWEFAAGGGTARKNCSGGCEYSGSNRIARVAWYKRNSNNRTHKIGTKDPNELGIYDMTGNVWEWCEDWYDTSQQHYNVRGGSWFRDAEHCNIYFRAHDHQSIRSYNIGFRVVLPL